MRLIAIAAVLALSGCLQQTQTRAPQSGAASASTPWQAGEATFTVEASASGPSCEHAVATLTIRSADGAPIYAEAHVAAHIMTLAPAHDVAAMRAALAQWIDPASNATMQTSAALPEWPANAQGPMNGEFPFYPEPAYDRERYGALRAANTPLYCYVQGMESMACLAASDGALEKVGVQAFPG